MKIIDAHVVRRSFGTDHVTFKTDLPSGVHPFEGPEYLELKLARGTAEVYLAKHFPGIPVTVYQDMTTYERFSKKESE